MSSLIASIAGFIKPYLFQVSIIIVSCSLVVLDNYIHATMKQLVKDFHFVLRVIAYIVLFTFIYGFLVTYLSPILFRLLASLNNQLLILSLLTGFVVLGVLIERK